MGGSSDRPFLGRTRALLRLILIPILTLWACLAIHFSNLPAQWMRDAGAILFFALTLGAFVFLKNRARTACGFYIAWAAVFAWWWFIPASHDRDWLPEYSKMPHAKIEGEKVTIKNIRDFHYRTEEDCDVRYVEKTYDLGELDTVDFSLTYWDGNTNIAHFMLHFGFGGKDYIAVSVETRREKGEVWNTVGGFFKQYELIVILAMEKDLLRLRTNVRNEQSYLYPTNFTPQEARSVFLEILNRANRLYEKPIFYNTIGHNCMTSLMPEVRKVREGKGFDMRLIFNGEADRMAYENGTIPTKLPFEEMKKLHFVNPHVADDPDDYSRKARPYLDE